MYFYTCTCCWYLWYWLVDCICIRSMSNFEGDFKLTILIFIKITELDIIINRFFPIFTPFSFLFTFTISTSICEFWRLKINSFYFLLSFWELRCWRFVLVLLYIRHLTRNTSMRTWVSSIQLGYRVLSSGTTRHFWTSSIPTRQHIYISS